MSMLRSVFISAATALVAAPLGLATAEAQTPISFGKTVGGSGFHIPSYVAMSRGLFKAEGKIGPEVTIEDYMEQCKITFTPGTVNEETLDVSYTAPTVGPSITQRPPAITANTMFNETLSPAIVSGPIYIWYWP